MLEWISLIVAIGTLLGVWLGPRLAEGWRRRKQIEEEVRKQVLELKDPSSEKSKKEAKKNLLKLGEDAMKPLRKHLEKSKEIEGEHALRQILYELGNEDAKRELISGLKEVVRVETNPERFSDFIEMIENLKVEELGPTLHERLEEERIDELAYYTIRVLGSLNYKEALPDILIRMENALEERKTDIVRACIMGTRDILKKSWNDIDEHTYNRITELYSDVLVGRDEWSIEAVLKDPLSFILMRSEDLEDSIRDKLLKNLVSVLNREKYEIKRHSIRRLADLGDRRAITHLEEMKEEESESSAIMSVLNNSLNRLKIRKENNFYD